MVVGGGATGVEFAGAFAELINGPLRRDYPSLQPNDVHLILLESRDCLLFGVPECLQQYTAKRLRLMGVDVRLGVGVSRVTPQSVVMKDETQIPTHTVVWTAGVQGSTRAEAWGLPRAGDGRIRVLPTLQVDGHPEVYVVGDLAFLEQDGKPLPMVAPVAVQQGMAAARNVLRQVAGCKPHPFRYEDPGMMVTIGRNAAVACVRRRCFAGFVAWLLWVMIHISKLIGFRNRLLVLINWAWDYLLFERAVRLVLPTAPNEGSRAKGADQIDRSGKADEQMIKTNVTQRRTV